MKPPLRPPALPSTLPDALAWAARPQRPGDPKAGLTYLDRRERPRFFSWARTRSQVLRAAAALREAGVAPGDRIALILPTGPEFVAAFFGCQAAGAVPVPLYPPVRLGRLGEYHDRTVAMIRAVRARAIVTSTRIGLLLGEVQARCALPLGVLRAASLDRDRGALPPARDLAHAPDDLAMVQFSSGTTVDPKPVGLTHGQVIANAGAILDHIEPEQAGTPGRPPLTGVCWLPLYHDMGLIGCIFTALLARGRLTLIPPEVFLSRPAIWLRAISAARASVSPAPNFAYALCTERIAQEDLEGVDLSCWRFALNGAEPVSASTMRAFQDRFAPFGLPASALRPVYGLAEVSLAVTFPPRERPYRTFQVDRAALARGRAVPGQGPQLVSTGVPLAGFGVQIRDPEGAVLDEDRVGRLWVSGPSLMDGYLDGRPSGIVDGWLDTGDLGFLHEGELYVTGRAKDVIVLRGENHLPQDIERAVDGVEGVRAGCAAAAGDLGPEGERLVLFVECRARRQGLAQACRRAVLAETGLDPALVLLLDPSTLPRTSSGKIRRAEALRRFHAGRLLPGAQVTPVMLAGAMAKSVLAGLRRPKGQAPEEG